MTTTQHDEPRSTPAMWTAKDLRRRQLRIKTLSASPSADCQGRSRERHPWESRRARGVLPHHPPLPGVAGIASPTMYIGQLQTAQTLPLYHYRPKGQGPKRKPADTIQDLTSSRPDFWAAGIHQLNTMPPVFLIKISHSKRRNGMLADVQIGILQSLRWIHLQM